jgi:hypothetical protein
LNHPTTILGINAFHGDASAALVVDGRLVAAVEEERFNRVKHWAGFPAASIRYVLEEGGIAARDIDHVAVSFDPKANLGRKALFALVNRPSLHSVIDRLRRQGKALSLRCGSSWPTHVACRRPSYGPRFITSSTMTRTWRVAFSSARSNRHRSCRSMVWATSSAP